MTRRPHDERMRALEALTDACLSVEPAFPMKREGPLARMQRWLRYRGGRVV